MSNRVRVTTTYTLVTTPGDLTAGDLVQFAQTLSPEAKVTVSVDHGDRPGLVSRGQVTLTATDRAPERGQA